MRMNGKELLLTSVVSFVVVNIAAVALGFLIGFRIGVLPIAVMTLFFIGFTPLLRDMVRDLLKNVADRNKVEQVQDRYSTLQQIADKYEGTYSNLGRAGKASLGNLGCKFEITARESLAGAQLIYVANLNEPNNINFKFSSQRFESKDLLEFKHQSGSSVYALASDRELASSIYRSQWEFLSQPEINLSLVCERGKVTLKQDVARVDYENIVETICDVCEIVKLIEDKSSLKASKAVAT